MSVGTPIYDTEGANLVGHPGTVVIIDYDTSVASGAALEKDRTYRFFAETACHFRFGVATPTAVDDDTPLAAGMPDYFTPVVSGMYVAVIKADGGTAGKFWATPMYRVGEVPA